MGKGEDRFQYEGPGIVKRKDGKERRRMTVYFPPELARQLSIYCASEGRQISDVVTEAVVQFLYESE